MKSKAVQLILRYSLWEEARCTARSFRLPEPKVQHKPGLPAQHALIIIITTTIIIYIYIIIIILLIIIIYYY